MNRAVNATVIYPACNCCAIGELSSSSDHPVSKCLNRYELDARKQSHTPQRESPVGCCRHSSVHWFLGCADIIHWPVLGEESKRASPCYEGKFVHGDAPEFLGAGTGVLRLQGVAGVEGCDVHVGHDRDGQIGRRVAAADHARSDRKVGRQEDVAQLLATASDRWSDEIMVMIISFRHKRYSVTNTRMTVDISMLARSHFMRSFHGCNWCNEL